MTPSWEQYEEVDHGGGGKILSRDHFFNLLDLEVKRARRYQNFFSVLVIKLKKLSSHDNGVNLGSCYQKLAHLLKEEIRESDVVGIVNDNSLAALLPYGDSVCGENAKSRFDRNLKYFDFPKEGYEINVDQICFPTDSTNTPDLLKRLMS
jgi:GGDEF domain-containing protein